MESTYSHPFSTQAPEVPVKAAPIPLDQRIVALDVVRGFALIGIFLMNIEWFSRAFGSANEGMPQGISGVNWLASWFVAYFVQGKFWTIFSLLFGMGFAVMLVRFERSGRNFVAIYLRRILALAVFGAVHYIFIWPGDILFSYAVGAGALLVVLYGTRKGILVSMAVLIALGFSPLLGKLAGMEDVAPIGQFFGMAGGLGFIGFMALYLRGKGGAWPVASVIMLVIGALMSIGAAALWLIPGAAEGPRLPFSVLGPLFLVLGALSKKYNMPEEKRSLRMAVTVFVSFAILPGIFGAIQYFTPTDDEIIAQAKLEAAATPAAAPVAPVAKAADKPADGKTDGKAGEKAAKPEKTKAERAVERKVEREKRLAERAESIRHETEVLSKGSYYDTLIFHATDFFDKIVGDTAFAGQLTAMFLLGMWFVRAGIMENTGAHLELFRKLAYIGLPVGLGLSIIASLIATQHIPGNSRDGFQFAYGVKQLGDLPACLGYVSMIVLMLHSKGPWSNVKVLAPVGRMALTNYLTQSTICCLYFYGYGLGHWGMPRAQQVLFVAVVYSLQVVFSTWWLARFRFGPMEWLWRGFTYREMPQLRIHAPAGAAAQPAG